MKSRSHIHEESFDVSPERMFDLLTNAVGDQAMVGSFAGNCRCTRRRCLDGGVG